LGAGISMAGLGLRNTVIFLNYIKLTVLKKVAIIIGAL